MDIWKFNQTVSRWLLRWNIVNIIVGLILWLKGGFWRGVGSQNIGWGMINILIATAGAKATENRLQSLNNPQNPAVLSHETTNMRRILQVNSALDLLYIFGGWRFSRSRQKMRNGVGTGIMIQGALLFVFDIFLLTRMPANKDIDAQS